MLSIKSVSLILAIWLQYTVVTVVAAVAARSDPKCRLVERGDSGVCGSGIYGELSPFLKDYPVAVEFCQAVYPVKCGKGKRGVASTTRAISTTPAITTPAITTPVLPTTKSASKPDKTKSAWSKCRNQPAKVISTLCSCIQTKCKSTTAKTSKTTTPETTKKTTPVTTPPTTTPVITTPVITTPVITTPVITTPVITTPVITTPSTTPSTTASTTAYVPCSDCEGSGCPGCNAFCRNGSCQFD